MDINAIFEAGGVRVPNPNYSKSKKNREPKYITVSDMDNAIPMSNGLASEAYRAAEIGGQDILGTNKELEKYKAYGITPNDWEDLNAQLAKRQSAFKKLGNAVAQAIVSEVAIGTFKGFSDLVDIAGRITGLSDEDYTNPVSRFLEEKQEEFRNFAPIYRDESLNIANGGLLDVGWWASNLPSIMSSLTLLLPAAGVVKGASMLSKAFNVGARTRQAVRAMSGASKRLKAAQAARAAGETAEEVARVGQLNKVQKFLTSSSTAKQTALFLENGTTATLSRAMENYQEARQTYNDMYAEASEKFKNDKDYKDFLKANQESFRQAGVDTNNKDEVAKYIATSAANRTFQTDWINVISDVVQMYGLRNAWRGIKNANGTSSKIRRENLDAAKYLGKSAEEIAKAKAARSFKEKAKEYIGDKLYGSKLAIAAQLGEGVEEAVNYIATEEGMRVGKLMLGNEKGVDKGFWNNLVTGFDGRLISYLATPELYDSAFWGTLGGVVFQAGGSKLMRLKNKIGNKSEANEESKQSLPWYMLDELPENKRRITEINARKQDFIEYKNKLDKINNNEDLEGYIEKSASNEEKQIARDRLKDEFVTKMTLRAMNSGNFNLLRSYLSDENLRKAFVETGVFNEKDNKKTNEEIERESKSYMEDIVRRIDNVANIYDEELNAIDYAATQIKGSFKREAYVPVEYMQIMASDNVRSRLLAENLDKELNAVNSRISTLMNDKAITDKLQPGVNYEQLAKVSILTRELGKLYAERKRVLASGKSLSNEVSLSEINRQIANIEKELTTSELILATHDALRFSVDEKNNYTQSETLESIKYRDAMITNRESLPVGSRLTFENDILDRLSDRTKTIISESEFGEFDVLKDQAKYVNEEKAKTGLTELDTLYQRKAVLEQSIKNIYSGIVKTTDEVEETAGVLNNTMNEMREKAIDESTDTIIKLYDKYGDRIKDFIINKYNSTPNKTFNRGDMTDVELNNLDDAVDVLKLTKAQNRMLMSVIDNMIELHNTIKDAKMEETKDETGEENTTSLEADTPSLAQQMDNPSTQPLEASIAYKNAQNEQIQPVTNPQQTDNRQPIFYTTFRTKNNTFRSSSHSNTDNGGSAVYDNGDSTYTIDVRNDPKMLNNSNMFSNADSVDITRPTEIVSKPIARRNANGKLEIIQKGELVNTDTLEYQESQAAEEQQVVGQDETQPTEQTTSPVESNEAVQTNNQSEVFIAPQTTQPVQQTESINEPIPTPVNITPEAQQATNLSTGEQVGSEVKPVQATNSKLDKEDRDVMIVEMSLADTIKIECMPVFFKEYKNGNTNLEEIANNIIEDYVKEGHPRDIVTASVNKAKDIIERRINKSKNKTNDVRHSTVDEVIIETAIAKSSITEEIITTNSFVQSYKDSVKNLIEQYAKEYGIEKYNGKYYINLEDLLRYTNDVTNDKSTARFIFDSLRSYLLTNEASKEFIVIDENEVKNDNELLKNVNKSTEERYIERVGDSSSQRIDLGSYIKTLQNDSELEAYNKVLETINVGDKLEYTVDNGRITIRNKDGKTIGFLPIPKINNKTGGFIMSNDGWISDILITNNGDVISDLKKTFESWLTEQTPSAKELNTIIYEFAFGKPNENRKQELLRQFTENDEIRLAKAKGLVDRRASNEQLINGLVKLWKYKDYRNSNVTSRRNANIKQSLNKWFEGLWNSYNAVMALKNNQVKDITVSSINEGSIIHITDTKGEAVKVAIPANKAIAGGPNPSIHKIAIANGGYLNTSGMVDQSFPDSNDNVTFVVFPNRSGNNDFIQAYVATTQDSFINSEAKEIFKALKDRVNNLLTDYMSNPTETKFNEIKDFLTKALYSPTNKPSLFYGVVAIDKGNVLVLQFGDRKITLKNGSDKIIITNEEYPVNENGYHQKSLDITSNEAKRNLNEFFNSLRFNINPTYIRSDNNTTMNLNGIATRSKDGKFNIKIGNETWTYDSYNAFILNNNLVRLNTKPNESGTSNYTRKNITKQKGNQVLRVTLNREAGSPVEMEQTTPIKPDSYVTAPISQKARTILNSTDRTLNKGLEIAKLIFNNKELKKFEKWNLLPKNIIFDEKFNEVKGREKTNAAVNPKTGEVIVGTKWLEMFNNLNTRPEAIRKLIHEQLHIRLYGNKDAINKATEIYNEFKKHVDNSNIPANSNIRQYLFSNESPEVAVEEFLVESLTSKELANYLNTIESKVDKQKGRTLFQQIMKFISDLFGWNINKDTLLEKEFYTLRDIFSKPSKTTKTTKVQSNQPSLFDNVESNEQADINDTVEKPVEKEEDITKETPIVVEDSEQPIDNPYGDDFSDDLIDDLESSITESDYTPEMEEIKAKTIADGTFMKAPNGNPTNLNERQWLQVRTKNFINWFGDWINNPSKASKVVDENGEPLVVYHSSSEYFTKFKHEFGASNTNARDSKALFFFMKDKQGSSWYSWMGNFRDKRHSGLNIDSYINFMMKNAKVLYTIDDNPMESWSIFDNGIVVVQWDSGSMVTDMNDPFIHNVLSEELIENIKQDIKTSDEDITDLINAYNYRDNLSNSYDVDAGVYIDSNPLLADKIEHLFVRQFFLNIRNIEDASNVNTESNQKTSLINYIKHEDKDGFIVKNTIDSATQSDLTDIYAVRKANQIKSATSNTGEFSKENDDVRYSNVSEIASDIPSVQSMQDRLLPEQQPKFASLVSSAAIRTSCK